MTRGVPETPLRSIEPCKVTHSISSNVQSLYLLPFPATFARKGERTLRSLIIQRNIAIYLEYKSQNAWQGFQTSNAQGIRNL